MRRHSGIDVAEWPMRYRVDIADWTYGVDIAELVLVVDTLEQTLHSIQYEVNMMN